MVSDMKPKGGARKGAGRKPNEFKAAREKALKDKETSADDIFNWFISVAKDVTEDKSIRMEAGKEVMNRIWGKHKQAVELAGKDGGSLEIKVVSYA